MTVLVTLPDRDRFRAWRDAARRLISHAIPPEDVDWSGAAPLFGGAALPPTEGPRRTRVPQEFLTLAEAVVWHSDPERFALLYRALWRLDRREGTPIDPGDPLGRRLVLMAKAVGRDIHKMHAFVRFREGTGSGSRRLFLAWFEPEHHTLEPGAPFFAERLADVDWTIATPRLTAVFRGGVLTFAPGQSRPSVPEDAAEGLWETYFASTFNPARVNPVAMRSEMPRKYWRNLPETALVPRLIAEAEGRVAGMAPSFDGAGQGAGVPRPEGASRGRRGADFSNSITD